MKQSKLTIVIPCKNEGWGIIQCLEGIQMQSEEYPTIIADSSDDPMQRSILRRWCMGKDWIRIIDGGLPSVARNRGAELADTDWVLFMDADMIIKDRNLLARSLKNITDMDLVTVRIRSTVPSWNPVWWGFDSIQYLMREPFALGGFQLWSREAFHRLGGFDEQVKVGEDWMLSRKVRPNRFRRLDYVIYTSPRRFRSYGIFSMIKLMVGAWLNRNNPHWFSNSHKYWKHHE
jgi:glycosyltransferase involved in cell wall biosynthesis